MSNVDHTQGPSRPPSIDFRFAPDRRWTSICRPDDAEKTVVREDGALMYGFRSDSTVDWSFERVVAFRPTTTHGPIEVSQHTEDARTPIVVTVARYPHLTLTMRAVGHLDARGRRSDLVAWELVVHDDAPEGLLVGLHLDVHEEGRRWAPPRWGPAEIAVSFPADALPDSDMFVDDELDLVAEDREDARPGACLFSFPTPLVRWHATGFLPASGLRTVPNTASPGERIAGVVVLPLTGEVDPAIDADWAEAAIETERRTWAELPALDLPVHVPDPDLQAMLISCARNLLQARDLDEHGRPLFQIGPTMYRSVFMVDGYFLIETARYLGLDADADHALEVLLDKVRPDGSVNFMADQLSDDVYPHHKETGIAIATLVRSWELTGDDDALAGRWPTVRRAVEHIERLRAQAHDLPDDHPAHGLMPPAYTDGGLSGKRAELSTTLWTLIGLQAAVRAATVVAPGDHDELARVTDELRTDLHRVLDRQQADGHAAIMALDPTDAHHTVPGRTTASPPHAINPGTGTWAFAQALHPGEVLATDHPTVTDFLELLDRIDDEQGIPAATGWLPYRALWTYYASFAGHAWLHAGRPDKMVDYLYALANHAAPTRVWREEQALSHTGDDQVFGDMPHNWASAEFLRMVRDLLVLERHAGVELLAGLPASWIVPGDPVRIATPTAFGHLDVVVAPDTPTSGSIRIEVAPGGAREGELAVRLPEGTWSLTVSDGAQVLFEEPARTGGELLALGTLIRGVLSPARQA